MSNASARLLTWIVLCAIMTASAWGRVDPAARFVPTQPVKGDPGPAAPGIPPSLTGGPDGAGYTFTDSTEPGGPVFSFVDISTTGTAVPLGDDAETSVPIGFSFPFYGSSFANVFIVSNGYLAFDAGSSGSFTNDCPLDGASPTNIIAPYWDDLDPGDDGASAFRETFAACPVGSGQCFIAQWEEFDLFPGDGTPGGTGGTFQAILYADGGILLQYQGGPGITGASATIATSQDGGANSLLYTCNTASISASLAIEYTPGAFGDLVMTKTGTPSQAGPYAYTLGVANNGPDTQNTVTVTDTLPAGISYVGDTCGGDLADGVWDVGSLAMGASDSCDLIVELVDPNTCSTVVNTATATGDILDPPGNSSATASNGGGEAIADPSFEAYTPNPSWTEASTNFGTPLCTIADCGTGTGTGPRTGDVWTWFGGIAGTEEGSVTQSVLISTGVTEMTFWLEMFVCNSAIDFMEVTIDGNQVYLVDGGSPLCGVLGYSEQTVDISAFADGGMHTLAFHSVTSSGGVTNFFVDDVSLPSTPDCSGMPVDPGGGGVNPLEIPTLDQIGLAALGLLLALAAMLGLRRRAHG